MVTGMVGKCGWRVVSAISVCYVTGSMLAAGLLYMRALSQDRRVVLWAHNTTLMKMGVCRTISLCVLMPTLSRSSSTNIISAPAK